MVDRPLVVGLDNQERLAVGDVAALALLARYPAYVVFLVGIDQRVLRHVEFERVVKDSGVDSAVVDTADGIDEVRSERVVPVCIGE